MRRVKVRQADSSEVDMTPMLDIVFILLIFFIVTTSFVKEKAITLQRPLASDTTKPNKEPPILIEINDTNQILIQGRVIDIEAIRANVESARSKSSTAAVIVRADEMSSAGSVIRAVDQARLAGAAKVTVIKPAL